MILRVSLSVIALTGCIAASSFAADEPVASQNTPEQVRDFLVAGGDGYGTSECLSSKSNCGAIVANAWCESKGYAKSVSYRLANKEESTGSIKTTIIDQAFIITCSAK